MEVNGEDEKVICKPNCPKLSLLLDTPYGHCLKHEVEFLMNGDMDMLINPTKLFMPNESEIWNDSMAYLSRNDNTDTSMINNQGKPLLKCRFVVTGRPKKIWALKIRNCSIEEDDLNNKWFQIGNDMLLTKRDDLLKYRMSVQ